MTVALRPKGLPTPVTDEDAPNNRWWLSIDKSGDVALRWLLNALERSAEESLLALSSNVKSAGVGGGG